MEDDRHAVARQPDVAFGAAAKCGGGAEGREAVFGNDRAVQPAVREAEPARLQRVSA